MSAEKNTVLTFLKSETGKKVFPANKFVDSFKQFSEGFKSIENFFTEALPELLLQVPEPLTGRQKRKRALKDPNAPKHPLSSYMIFTKEMRPILKEEIPDLDTKLIVTEIGRRWKELDAEEKKKYEEKAAALKAEYTEEKARYDESKNANVLLPAAEDSSDEEEQGDENDAASTTSSSESEGSTMSEPSEEPSSGTEITAKPVKSKSLEVKTPGATPDKQAMPTPKAEPVKQVKKTASLVKLAPKPPVLQEVQPKSSQGVEAKEKKHKKSKKSHPSSPVLDTSSVPASKKSKKSTGA